MIPWLLTVRGQRYEYELNLLLEAKQAVVGPLTTTVPPEMVAFPLESRLSPF